MERFLVTAAQPTLIDAARQNLAQIWPFAVAQLELTRGARWGFVVAVSALFGLLMMAPYVGQAWLLPAALLLIVAPATIRLLAIVQKPQAVEPARRADDDDLPFYSVLVPLRDEAAMVPQLAAALRAMDYPVLCSSHT